MDLSDLLSILFVFGTIGLTYLVLTNAAKNITEYLEVFKSQIQNEQNKYQIKEEFNQTIKALLNILNKQEIILKDFVVSKNESFQSFVNELNNAFEYIHSTYVTINKESDNVFSIGTTHKKLELDLSSIINERNAKLIDLLEAELTAIKLELKTKLNI